MEGPDPSLRHAALQLLHKLAGFEATAALLRHADCTVSSLAELFQDKSVHVAMAASVRRHAP